MCLTFSYDAGCTTLKHMRKTSVCGSARKRAQEKVQPQLRERVSRCLGQAHQ